MYHVHMHMINSTLRNIMYPSLQMSSLDSEQLVEDESIAAAAYLLSIVVKK